MLQTKSSNFMARFTISLKNGFRHKLNHPKQRRSNFKPPEFYEYFINFDLIRKTITLGLPDLESAKKDAPHDTHIVHFGYYLIFFNITPLIILEDTSQFSNPCYSPVHCNSGLDNYKITLELGYRDW
jgi:hypothetical protein